MIRARGSPRYSGAWGSRSHAFQALVCPILDATARSPSYAEFATGFGFTAAKSRWHFDRYLPPEVDRRPSRMSLLLAGDFAGLPPTVVVTAELDPLRHDGERYAALLRAAGAGAWRVPGTIHGSVQVTRARGASRRLHRELGAWIGAHAA